jgi:C-terminal binding protein
MKKRVIIIDSCVERHFEDTKVESTILPDFDIYHFHIDSLNQLDNQLLSQVDAVIIWSCLPSIYFDEKFISKLTECKVVVKAAVGYDNINIAAARARKISVYNTPDYGTEEVADHSLSLILALVRKLKATDLHVQAGGWDWKSIGSTLRLSHTKLGIIGFGRIGIAVARRAMAFGMDVSFFDPYVSSGVDKAIGVARYEDLHQLLAESDIISVNCSLTDSSRNLLSESAFHSMKSGAILVNTARGGVIETQALITALASGKVALAGLDVVADEPNIPTELTNNPNVILTPHSAFYSDPSFYEMRSKSAWMVKNSLKGLTIRNRLDDRVVI